METLTEDQIAKLSEEFDLRAQDDGVIKTESMEELSQVTTVSSEVSKIDTVIQESNIALTSE